MDKQQAKTRIAKLREEINHHRYLYHVLDREEISGAALDSLKHELVFLEQKFPCFISPDSPSQRVCGKPLAKFSKVKHSKPALSLEDVFEIEELEEWLEKNKRLASGKYDFYSELKLDGLTVVLTYFNGIFTKGATRGDGETGEDVTQNLKTIESIPLSIYKNLKFKGQNLNLPKIFEVRGEVVMTKKVFSRINKEQKKAGLPVFANPRNVAAGSLRQLDPKITASRKLECFAFEIITDIGQKTHAEVHEILRSLGFKTNTHNEYSPDLSAVGRYLKKWESARALLDYQTDGVVVVVNDISLQKKLGSVGKTERWMAAYKFPAEQTTTIVEDIKIQVGRTGALTPVAILRPVKVAGSTVSRATLHNLDEINRLDIRIGDTVILQKAGDVIPDIIKILPKLRIGKEKKFIMPDFCPICQNPTVRPEGEVNYYCSNPKCFAVEKEKIVHFASKKAFNIEGMGPKIIEHLIDNGLISNAADLFKLTEGDLEPLERFAEKSARNLVSSINETKNIGLDKFIYALGIRHVGEETAYALALNFKTLARIASASFEELQAIRDIGGIVAESVYNYFHDLNNLRLLKEFESFGIKAFFSAPESNSAVSGKVFVLTGALNILNRDEAKEKIRKAGGIISETVSKKTDYAVAGTEPGSKFNKAKKLGVNILNEKQFLDMF